MQVTMRSENHVGYVTLSNPPVNAIGQALRQGLLEAVRWAERDRLDRVIVFGAGGVFAAGADAKEFDSPPQVPHLPEVLNAIDESFVPWIAAIESSPVDCPAWGVHRLAPARVPYAPKRKL